MLHDARDLTTVWNSIFGKSTTNSIQFTDTATFAKHKMPISFETLKFLLKSKSRFIYGNKLQTDRCTHRQKCRIAITL